MNGRLEKGAAQRGGISTATLQRVSVRDRVLYTLAPCVCVSVCLCFCVCACVCVCA